MDDIPRDEVVTTIDRVVDELLKKAGVQKPPVDAIALAQGHLGMVVVLDQRLKEQRGRAQRAGRTPQIFLRPEPTEERHQWTVAHEIGEHLKPELLRRLQIDSDQAKTLTGESLANLFSSRLLVPTCWFAKDAPALEYDLLELKKLYSSSSHEVIALRFLDLPEPCVVTVLDNEAIRRRKSNGPRIRATQLTPVEEKCQRYVNKNGRPKRISEKGWTVQGWPVHSADWKREILRSVVEEGADYQETDD